MRFFIGVAAFVGAMPLAFADPPSGVTPTPPATSASAPAAAAVSNSASVTAPAASANAPAAAASAESKPAVVVQAAADAQEKHFLAEGYKMEMRNGEKVFCRREEEMGTRLGAHKVCGTAPQLQLLEQESQNMVNRSMMQQNNPAGK